MTSPVTYTAFGERRSGTPVSPFGFIGGLNALTDSDSGLTLMGHRYYQADIGRFLSPDPARSGDNWYDYCENDPVNSVDPLGLDTQVRKGSKEYNAILSAIARIRAMGNTAAADALQKMLDEGRIWIADWRSSNTATTTYPVVGKATIILHPVLFLPAGQTGWITLTGTLYHEFIHVSQGWYNYWLGNLAQAEADAYRAEIIFLTKLLAWLQRIHASPQLIRAVRADIENAKEELAKKQAESNKTTPVGTIGVDKPEKWTGRP